MPAPARDLDLTRKRLLEWLPRQFPGARDLAITSMHGPETTGFSNDTLMFDLRWQEAGAAHTAELVARLEPSGLPVFPEYDLSLQHRVMERLADTAVRVPRTFGFEDDPSWLGAPFFLMQRVAGRIPTDNPPYHAGGWVTEIAPAARAALWNDGLDQLAEIHRLDWQALDLGFLAPADPGATRLEQHLAYYERYLDWIDLRGRHPTCDPALAWLRANRPAGTPPERACWGDARIGNMIFDDDRCVAVLDWEMARLGNPVEDLAWWLVIDRHHSEGIGTARLEGFPERAETIARWEAATGLPAADVEYYEIFAAFRFSVIMARVGQQMREAGLLPDTSRFEVDNTITRVLAAMLDLPAPAEV